jgi:hypothetical protein
MPLPVCVRRAHLPTALRFGEGYDGEGDDDSLSSLNSI